MSIEIHALIIGEAADPSVEAGIRRIIGAEGGRQAARCAQVNELRTMHLGPEDILVTASLDFHDTQSARDVEATTARLDRAIKAAYPAVRRLFLEVEQAQGAVGAGAATTVSARR